MLGRLEKAMETTSTTNLTVSFILTPSTLSMKVLGYRPGVIYLRLPKELRRPITSGCDCKYCKAHPDIPPTWDTLAVPTGDKPDQTSWTVHMPEAGAMD